MLTRRFPLCRRGFQALAGIGFCLMVMAGPSALAMASAEQGESAVARHEPRLPPAVTVWCLAKPNRVVGSAQAFGVQAGHVSEAGEFQYWDENSYFDAWARSADPDAAREFDQACRAAFVAFSHSGISLALYGLTSAELRDALDGNSDSDDLRLGLGGVLLGAGLAGAGGLASYRRRAHHGDAEELRGLDVQFRQAVALYAVSRNPGTERQLQVSCRLLYDTVGEWKPHGRIGKRVPWRVSEKEIDLAQGELNAFLEKKAPGIKNLGSGDGEERKEGAREVLQAADAIHRRIAGIAEPVSKFYRVGDRKPGSRPDGGASGR